MIFTILGRILPLIGPLISGISPGSALADKANQITALFEGAFGALSTKLVPITGIQSAYNDLTFIDSEVRSLPGVSQNVLTIVENIKNLLGTLVGFEPPTNAAAILNDIAVAWKAAAAEGVQLPALATEIESYIVDIPALIQRIKTGYAVKEFDVTVEGVQCGQFTIPLSATDELPKSYQPVPDAVVAAVVADAAQPAP